MRALTRPATPRGLDVPSGTSSKDKDERTRGVLVDITVEVAIAAPPEAVWSTLIEVEGWPEWTASVTGVTRLDEAPLRVGSRVKIKQPRMKALVWQVTELAPQRSFTWVARSPGVATVARHDFTPGPNGTVLTLTIEQRGPLAGLIRLLMNSQTRRYLTMEANGIKARCEAERATEATQTTQP
jgi:uncharacterized protein YndB with AHSA1/START domain